MIDTVGYACRLIARYWAIPALVILLIAMLVLWCTQARWSGRISPMAPFVVVFACLLAIAIPATQAFGKAAAALQGAPERPTLMGPLAVASYDIALAAGGERSRTIRVWRPAADAAPLSATTCDEAFTSAPPGAPGNIPLILYAPGWGGDRGENARTAAMLASHGFVVAALDDVAPDVQFDFSSESAVAETDRLAAARLELALNEARVALDQLRACIASQQAWRDKIDFDRVGFMGFSFGGAVAAEASLRDPRIAAVANLDGGLYEQAAAQGARRPYLVMASDFDPPSARRLASSRRYEWRILYEGVLNEAAHTRRLGGDIFLIRGAPHNAFLDAYGERRQIKHWLLLPAARAEAIKHDYLLRFFEANLRGDGEDLSATSSYSEVITFNEMSSLLERIATAP